MQAQSVEPDVLTLSLAISACEAALACSACGLQQPATRADAHMC